MIKDKENRAEIVRKLAAQGMNSSQIARETGISPGSVYYYMHPEKKRKQEIFITDPEKSCITNTA